MSRKSHDKELKKVEKQKKQFVEKNYEMFFGRQTKKSILFFSQKN